MRNLNINELNAISGGSEERICSGRVYETPKSIIWNQMPTWGCIVDRAAEKQRAEKLASETGKPVMIVW